jgi:hypothetical protein
MQLNWRTAPDPLLTVEAHFEELDFQTAHVIAEIAAERRIHWLIEHSSVEERACIAPVAFDILKPQAGIAAHCTDIRRSDIEHQQAIVERAKVVVEE